MYVITLCVHAQCEFYKIDQGAIEVGWDGIAALERGFENSSSAARHFDLILAIHNIREHCPVR
jgi:hypothetical protein